MKEKKRESFFVGFCFDPTGLFAIPERNEKNSTLMPIRFSIGRERAREAGGKAAVAAVKEGGREGSRGRSRFTFRFFPLDLQSPQCRSLLLRATASPPPRLLRLPLCRPRLPSSASSAGAEPQRRRSLVSKVFFREAIDLSSLLSTSRRRSHPFSSSRLSLHHSLPHTVIDGLAPQGPAKRPSRGLEGALSRLGISDEAEKKSKEEEKDASSSMLSSAFRRVATGGRGALAAALAAAAAAAAAAVGTSAAAAVSPPPAAETTTNEERSLPRYRQVAGRRRKRGAEAAASSKSKGSKGASTSAASSLARKGEDNDAALARAVAAAAAGGAAVVELELVSSSSEDDDDEESESESKSEEEQDGELDEEGLRKTAPYLEMVGEYLASQPSAAGKDKTRRRRMKKKKTKRREEGEGEESAAAAAAAGAAATSNRPSTAATVDSADGSPSAYVYDYYVISNEAGGGKAGVAPRVALDEGLVWWPGLDDGGDGDGDLDALFENGGGSDAEPGADASSDSNAEGYYANSYPDEEEDEEDEEGRRFEKSSSGEGEEGDTDDDGEQGEKRHRRRLDDFLDDDDDEGEERGYGSEY